MLDRVSGDAMRDLPDRHPGTSGQLQVAVRRSATDPLCSSKSATSVPIGQVPKLPQDVRESSSWSPPVGPQQILKIAYIPAT